MKHHIKSFVDLCPPLIKIVSDSYSSSERNSNLPRRCMSFVLTIQLFYNGTSVKKEKRSTEIVSTHSYRSSTVVILSWFECFCGQASWFLRCFSRSVCILRTLIWACVTLIIISVGYLWISSLEKKVLREDNSFNCYFFFLSSLFLMGWQLSQEHIDFLQ